MPEIQRVLDAGVVDLPRLELGAGGAYAALTSFTHFHGAEVAGSGFPDMVVDTEELRVLDTRTGAALARYRSWCDGVITVTITTEYNGWQCAALAGQTAPVTHDLEHHVASLAFLYGQR